MLDISVECSTVLLGMALFFALYYFMKSRQKANFPPGPSGFPIVGYVPFATGNLGEKFTNLKEKYGDVMSVKIGLEDWVILNGFDVINEVSMYSDL